MRIKLFIPESIAAGI